MKNSGKNRNKNENHWGGCLGKNMAWCGCDWYSFCKFANYGGIVCSYSILSVEMYILRLLFDAPSTPSGFRICGCAFD